MAEIYYKATRPTDPATDFYTGQVVYEVGKRVRPLERATVPQCCEAGVLHAADVPSMTLVGGPWPCRLFEVTGKPVAGFRGEHPHKGAFRQLTVVREIDAHLALGPNGRYVAGLIKRARQLTYQEAQDLAAAWDAARDAAGNAARAAAWGAARAAARAAAGNAAWGAARGAAWGAARGAAWGAARAAARDAAWAAVWDAARGAAWDAARDAARVLVVRDLITPEQFDVLYGLWGEVIGSPEEMLGYA